MDLPDDLELPLASGQGYWYWLGGRPSVDLVNTLRERWWRQVETLVTAADLAVWLVRVELLPAGSQARATRAQLEQVRTLREAVDAAVVALDSGEGIPAATVKTINSQLPAGDIEERLVVESAGVPTLMPVGRRGAVDNALGLLARDAAVLLGTDQRRRVRICASDTCSARFYDHSPAGRRRWCSMEGCGNVAKARRHRERVAAKL